MKASPQLPYLHSIMMEYQVPDTISNVNPRRRRDTVIKASVVIDSSRVKTREESVASMVAAELRGNCHIADSDLFLTSILPLPQTWIDGVYDKVVADGTYTQGSWTSLPQEERKECDLYVPFANVANAINKACAAIHLPTHVNNYWVDRHSTSPKSRDGDAAAIRPDIVSVLGEAEALEGWEKEMESLKESIDNLKDPETKSKESKDLRDKVRVLYATSTCHSVSPFHIQKKELDKMLETWWLRVHIPVEIKAKKDDKDVLEAVKQLCGYLRQVLREQMDRRFVLGLVFCGTDISIWLCDRSGLLGTATPINIHKVSRFFITFCGK